jgi:hypothetical protein
MSQEILTSLDVVFAASGGTHSAATTSVAGDNRIGEGVGNILGSVGERPRFSKKELNRLLGNFVIDSVTTTNNDTSTTIKRDYVHRISLIMDSHLILVRGIQASPILNKVPEYSGPIVKYGEMPKITRSGIRVIPAHIKLPVSGKEPKLLGNVLVIGKTYNTISTQLEDNTRSYVVYHNEKLIEELSDNPDASLGSSIFVGNGESPQNAELKYGYTIAELKSALSLIGISISGLPEKENIIFDSSGTVRDVVSDVANTLGYYWYVDPLSSNSISFVSSSYAVSIEVENPTTSGENLLNASFTESLWPNQNVLSVITNTETPKGYTVNYPRQGTKKPFYQIDILSYFTEDAKRAVAIFYGYFSSGDGGGQFDKIVYTALTAPTALKYVLASGLYLNGYTEGDLDLTSQTLDDIFNGDPDEKYQDSPVFGSRSGSVFNKLISLKYAEGNQEEETDKKKMIPKPSDSKLFTAVSTVAKFVNGFYISYPMSKARSSTTTFSSSSHNILGPFRGDKKLSEISEVSLFASFADIVRNKASKDKAAETGDDAVEPSPLTVQNLFQATGAPRKPAVSGTSSYFFIAINNQPFENELFEEGGALDYTSLEEEVEMPSFGDSVPRIGYKNSGTREGLIQKLVQSRDLLLKKWDKDNKKTFYATRTNNDSDKSGEGGQDAEEGLDYELFNYNIFNYQSYNQSRLKLQSFNGSLNEIKHLQEAHLSSAASAPEKALSNTKTTLGLNIPENFGMEIGSISVNIGGDGVQTTVSKSNYSFITPSQDVIKSDGKKVNITTNMLGMLRPRQRSFLKL